MLMCFLQIETLTAWLINKQNLAYIVDDIHT